MIYIPPAPSPQAPLQLPLHPSTLNSNIFKKAPMLRFAEWLMTKKWCISFEILRGPESKWFIGEGQRSTSPNVKSDFWSNDAREKLWAKNRNEFFRKFLFKSQDNFDVNHSKNKKKRMKKQTDAFKTEIIKQEWNATNALTSNDHSKNRNYLLSGTIGVPSKRNRHWPKNKNLALKLVKLSPTPVKISPGEAKRDCN